MIGYLFWITVMSRKTCLRCSPARTACSRRAPRTNRSFRAAARSTCAGAARRPAGGPLAPPAKSGAGEPDVAAVLSPSASGSGQWLAADPTWRGVPAQSNKSGREKELENLLRLHDAGLVYLKKKFCKIFQILRHIKFLYVCIEY